MAIEPAPVEINLREPRKRERDFSALLWLCGWGVATAVALSALAITSQTQTATDRLRSIFAVSEPTGVAQMPPRIAQLELETKMLTEQVRALNADRDRLAGRIALLQSSVDDMTGAIKRQAAATAACPCRTSGSPRIAAAAEHCPVGGRCDPGHCCARSQNRFRHHLICSSAARTRRGCAGGRRARTAGKHERVRPRSRRAHRRCEGVQQRWTTVKANFGPLLSNLHPLAAPERRHGKPGYRLVVGPLPNSPAATGLCAHFNAAHTPCRPSSLRANRLRSVDRRGIAAPY